MKHVKGAVFSLFSLIAICGLAQTCTWSGAASGYWDDGANWSTGVAPQAGDDVVINKWINNSFTVNITNSTPRLNSLRLAETYVCTLVVSNWNTCIQADSITIGKKGTLTCSRSYDKADTNDMSRVYISCGDLTIAAGGKIDVDGRGYDMSKVSGDGAAGLGPGAGSGADTTFDTHSGAAHGGYGGTWRGKSKLPYDNPEAPVYPGSSGGRTKYGSSVSGGGGAVRIVATGTVTVNGSILASAENTAKYNQTGFANDNTGGSGGSIFIEASVFKGLDGVLRADGASTACPTNSNTGRAGGGGMIAVHYDTSLQQAGDVSGMTISAAPGIYKMKSWELPLVSNDLYRSEAGLGTLWFSDEKMLESLGTGITGRIESMPDLTLDSLVMTAGHVAFPKGGGHLTVLGDLVVSGSVARLEIGGDVATNHHGNATFRSGKTPCRLTVGGSLRVIDGARFDVRSAETNAMMGTVGALVKVDGAMEVTGGSSVYCWSDTLNGGSPRFEVGTLYVGAGSLFTANSRGYAGYFSMWQGSGVAGGGACGPGAGRNESSSTTISFTSAGGHGGYGGGRANNSGGNKYDDPFYPALPGSGGSSSTSWAYHAGDGGGVIDVRATGAILVDGEISADGGRSGHVNNKGGIGSGAGGTVFLYGDTVTSSPGSKISAKGGDEYVSSETCAYVGGGGGRISIWAGAAMSTEGVKASRIMRGSDPEEFGSPRISLAGIVTAAGGVGTHVWSESWSSSGGDGTIWLTSIEPPSGLRIIFK